MMSTGCPVNAELAGYHGRRDNDIAIVGMACRFPGADDLQQLWRLLMEGTTSFGPIPANRWRAADFFDPSRRDPDRAYTDIGAFVEDIERFAGAHFRMPPRRVEVMDPQQRLLIEAVRVALEDAGNDERPIGHDVGVYIGVSTSDYRDRVTAKLRSRALASGAFGKATDAELTELACRVPAVRPFTMPGTLLNMTAATVSQTFDFNGPSIAIDSACASSLAALQQGVTAIRAGQCEAAIVGGVHLNLSPDSLVGFCRIGAVSKSGRCRPFDQAADGFVLGEGVGVVVLRRLQAVTSADKVYAVIKGLGGSNDGRGAGPMAPRQQGQQLAMLRAYQDAGVDPTSVGYVEAHGTGTAVGDVVEINSLRAALGEGTGLAPCFVSSIKANIGHTMSAAGIASVIKTALVLKHGIVPPHPSFETANPKLELARSRFVIPVAAQRLQGNDGAAVRAAVNAFGFGGTNVHAVLEAVPEPQPCAASAELPELVVLSAATHDLLIDYAGSIVGAVRADETASVADIACELAGRKLQRHVLAIVASGRDELTAALAAAIERLRRNDARALHIGEGWFLGDREATPSPRVTFLFPGQGAQRVNELRDLYTRFPEFRHTLDRLADTADSATGHGFLDTLYPSPESDLDTVADRLADTRICQPALAATALAQSALLAHAAIRPHAALGHSLGEFSAAGALGVLSDADVATFVARRGAIMADGADDAEGAMLAIRANAADVRGYLNGIDNVWIASENEPKQLVVGGAVAGIDQLRARLKVAGIGCQVLRVSHAFHTPLMAAAAEKLDLIITALQPRDPKQRLISCITGKPYADAFEMQRAWQEHTTTPVRFETALRAAAERTDIFVQIGSGRALLQMAKAVLEPSSHHFIATAGNIPDGGRSLLVAAAELLALGVPVRVRAFTTNRRQAITLPATPLPTETYPLVGGPVRDATETVPVDIHPVAPASVPRRTETTAETAPVVVPDAEMTDASTSGNTVMDNIIALFRQQAAVLQAYAAGQASGHRPVPTMAPTQDYLPSWVTPAAAAAEHTTLPSTEDITAQVTEIISQVSAFPADTLRPDQSLVGDLGFDSLMFTEAATRLIRKWPAVDKETLASALKADSTVVDLAQVIASATGLAVGTTAAPAAAEVSAPAAQTRAGEAVKAEYRVHEFPEYQALRDRLRLADVFDVRNPYFSVHEGVIGDTTTIEGRTAISFSSYNYLGLTGDPAVTAAAKQALDRYGTSVSASRMLSGDKPLHRELEAEIKDLLGTEDALVLVSGHATNVTTIGHIVGPGDVILHDTLAHDSILQGCKLSRATRRPFTHNDWQQLDRTLHTIRDQYRRAIIVIEGAYSMDGDIPELPRFIDVARRHQAMLMVDEAHSIGVLGATGGGIGEHFGVDPSDVEIWMGTLSKTLSSCGGYVAGSAALIEYFKYTLPGFIYSCGLPPASAGASLAAIRVMRAQPERLTKLHQNARLFKTLAQQAGLTTGLAEGTAVVPVIVGESIRCLRVASALHERGIHVNPILYPAVEESGARLRFFMTSLHTEEQIRHAVQVLAEEFDRVSRTENEAA